MSARKAICLVCGEPLVYWEEAREVTCRTCGKKEFGHSVCEVGHYVCDACHRAEGVDNIMGLCSRSASTDPIEIMNQAMADKSIYPNGPEHHTLVGASPTSEALAAASVLAIPPCSPLFPTST